MYQIIRSDGAVLFDVDHVDNYMLTEPRSKLEVGQPGSLQFCLLPDHPLYDDVQVMETYVSAYKEGEEIFYGRVIDANINPVTGERQFEAAGALQFLDDGELPPTEIPEVPEGQEKPEGEEMTAEALFRKCITAHNSEVGSDSRRQLGIGIIRHSKSGETKMYNFQSYTKIRTVMETNLTGEYGGFFRIRKVDDAHVIDWVETYEEPNNSPIEIAYNVQSQENMITASDMVTVLRPTGKDGIGLTEGTVPISNDLVNKYGRIIQSINFKDADTEEKLRSETNKYIARIGKGTNKVCNVKVVDMHLMDDRMDPIRLGAIYTNIQGFEGEEMMVAAIELNFVNPADDLITLKNWKELLGNMSGKSSIGSTMTQKIAQTYNGSVYSPTFKYITETGDELKLQAPIIKMIAEEITVYANKIERYAKEFGDYATYFEGELGDMYGSGVLQNSDLITQVVGVFHTRYVPVPEKDKYFPGIEPRRPKIPKNCGWYEPYQYQFQGTDLNSGIEIFQTLAQAQMGKGASTWIQTATDPDTGKQVVIWNPKDPDNNPFWRFKMTEDSSLVEGKTYYTKGLVTSLGTEVILTEDGQEINVKEVAEVSWNDHEFRESIEGSALWTKKDHITGVCGLYDIVDEIGPDGQPTGKRYLVIQEGGGLQIERDGTRFGMWDSGNLTAGVVAGIIRNGDEKIPFKNIDSDTTDYTALGLYSEDTLTAGVLVEKLNDGSTQTTISGDRVSITANQMASIATYTEGRIDAGFIVGKITNDNKKIPFKNIDSKTTDYTAMGLFSDDTLTAGVLVEKLNDGSTQTKISGDRVSITANQMAALGIYTEDHFDAGFIVDRLNDGSTQAKILGDRVQITANQMAELGIRQDSYYTAGLLVERINANSGSSKINLNQLESNVEYYTSLGIYDRNTLTGGILVQKLNDESTVTKILGSKVDITADQVRIGQGNVGSWMNDTDNWKTSTDDTLENYAGLIADKASIQQLYAQTARIDTIENSMLTSESLSAISITCAGIDTDVIDCKGITCDGSIVATSMFLGGSQAFSDVCVGAEKSVDGKELTLYFANSEPVNFRKAATVDVSGFWSGNTYKVKDNESGTVLVTSEPITVLGFSTQQGPRVGAYYTSSGGSTQISGADAAVTLELSDADTSYSSTTTAQVKIGGTTLTNISLSGYWNKAFASGRTDGVNSVTATDPTQPNGASMNTGGKSYNVYARSNASNGSTKDKTFVIDTTGSYNAGWSGCYGTVGLNKTTQQDLGYGGSVTIYAQAKASSSASSKTNVSSVKITAPANNYQSGYNAGKTDGVNSVTATDPTQPNGASMNTGGKSYNVYARSNASNGSTKDKTFVIDTTGSYNAGWSGCYGTVGLNTTTQQNLGYGGSVTIYAQAKSSSGASSKTNVSSVKITAPANNYDSGYSAGWGACYGTVRLDSTTETELAYSGSVTVYAQAKAYGASNYTNIQSRKIKSKADRYQTGYDAGYSAGYSAGEQAGYNDGYATGYNAVSTLRIVDSNDTQIGSKTLGFGETLTIWPAYTKYGGGNKYGGDVYITAPSLGEGTWSYYYEPGTSYNYQFSFTVGGKTWWSRSYRFGGMMIG